MQRTEIITVERRRRWSASEKLRIVAESLEATGGVSAVARRYGLHPSQLFAWRKAARGEPSVGAGSGFVPVMVETAPPPAIVDAGRMEIVLLSGRRILVDAGVDVAALGRVVAVLER